LAFSSSDRFVGNTTTTERQQGKPEVQKGKYTEPLDR